KEEPPRSCSTSLGSGSSVFPASPGSTRTFPGMRCPVADVSYAPTEELGLVRSTAREYLEDRYNLSRVRERMMSDTGFDRTGWSDFAEMGWTGLAIPEEHGGAGYGFLELSVVLEEMGRLVTPGPFFTSTVLAT